MEFLPLVALPFLINKVLDWARSLLPDPVEAKLIIPISWLLGVVGTIAFARSDWGHEMNVGDHPFADLSTLSLVLVGLVIGATAGIVSDFKPSRLTPEQLNRAVEKADTLVVESPAALPEPLKKRTR